MLEIRRMNDYNSILVFVSLKDRYRPQSANSLEAYQAATHPV